MGDSYQLIPLTQFRWKPHVTGISSWPDFIWSHVDFVEMEWNFSSSKMPFYPSFWFSKAEQICSLNSLRRGEGYTQGRQCSALQLTCLKSWQKLKNRNSWLNFAWVKCSLKLFHFFFLNEKKINPKIKRIRASRGMNLLGLKSWSGTVVAD